MTTSLSNIVDDLAEDIHKVKCKNWNFFLKYERAKDNFIKNKRSFCNKYYSNKIDGELKKRFKNTF